MSDGKLVVAVGLVLAVPTTALTTIQIWERYHTEPDSCDGVYARPLGNELYLCHEGPKVHELQVKLKQLGYDVDLTSRYDRETRALIIDFRTAPRGWSSTAKPGRTPARNRCSGRGSTAFHDGWPVGVRQVSIEVTRPAEPPGFMTGAHRAGARSRWSGNLYSLRIGASGAVVYGSSWPASASASHRSYRSGDHARSMTSRW